MKKIKKTITSYVNEKKWDDGGHTLSFRMDEYTRNKLMAVPDGTYIQICQSRNTGSDDAPYYMNYEVKENQQAPRPEEDDIPF